MTQVLFHDCIADGELVGKYLCIRSVIKASPVPLIVQAQTAKKDSPCCESPDLRSNPRAKDSPPEPCMMTNIDILEDQA